MSAKTRAERSIPGRSPWRFPSARQVGRSRVGRGGATEVVPGAKASARRLRPRRDQVDLPRLGRRGLRESPWSPAGSTTLGAPTLVNSMRHGWSAFTGCTRPSSTTCTTGRYQARPADRAAPARRSSPPLAPCARAKRNLRNDPVSDAAACWAGDLRFPDRPVVSASGDYWRTASASSGLARVVAEQAASSPTVTVSTIITTTSSAGVNAAYRRARACSDRRTSGWMRAGGHGFNLMRAVDGVRALRMSGVLVLPGLVVHAEGTRRRNRCSSVPALRGGTCCPRVLDASAFSMRAFQPVAPRASPGGVDRDAVGDLAPAAVSHHRLHGGGEAGLALAAATLCLLSLTRWKMRGDGVARARR